MRIKQEKVFPEAIVAAEVCPTMSLLAVATSTYLSVIRTKTMSTLFSIHATTSSTSTGIPATATALIDSNKRIASVQWSPCGQLISLLFEQVSKANSQSPSPFILIAQIVHVEGMQVVRDIVALNHSFDLTQSGRPEYEIKARLCASITQSSSTPVTIISEHFSRSCQSTLGVGWGTLPVCNLFSKAGEAEYAPLRPAFEAAAQGLGSGAAGTTNAPYAHLPRNDFTNEESAYTTVDQNKGIAGVHPQSTIPSDPNHQNTIDTAKPLTLILSVESLKRSWSNGQCSVLLLWGSSGQMSLFAGGFVCIGTSVVTSPSKSTDNLSLLKLHMDPLTHIIGGTPVSNKSKKGSCHNLLSISAFSNRSDANTSLSPSSIENKLLVGIADELCRAAVGCLTAAISVYWDAPKKVALDALRILGGKQRNNTSISVNPLTIREVLPVLLVGGVPASTTQAGPITSAPPSTTIPTSYHYNNGVLSLLQDTVLSFAARPYYNDICEYFGVGGSALKSKNNTNGLRKFKLEPVDGQELQSAALLIDKGFGTLLKIVNNCVLPALTLAFCYSTKSIGNDTTEESESRSQVIARAIHHSEALVQESAGERDDLLLLLQFVLQQKAKITAQQRNTIGKSLPPPQQQQQPVFLSDTEELLQQMMPSELPKIADTLVPIAAALVPRDYEEVLDVLDTYSTEGAFSPHIIVGTGYIYDNTSAAPLWHASCLTIPLSAVYHDVTIKMVEEARTTAAVNIDIFEGNDSVSNIFVDVPTPLKTGAAGKTGNGSIIHDLDCTHLLTAGNENTDLGGCSSFISANISYDQLQLSMVNPLLDGLVSPSSATNVDLDPELFTGGSTLTSLVVTPTHIALLLPIKAGNSWLKSQIKNDVAVQSSRDFAVIVLLEKDSYEADEGLTGHSNGAIILPTSMTSASTFQIENTKISINTDKGLLAVSNGTRMVLFDLFEDDVVEDAEDDEDNFVSVN